MRDRGLLEAFLMLLCALAAVVALVAGCSNDLPAASRLERTRVLGARVRVAADPGRADAEPGESAAIEWLVAGPRTPPSLAWVFAQCTGVGGACADAPAPVASGMGFPVSWCRAKRSSTSRVATQCSSTCEGNSTKSRATSVPASEG